MTLNPWNAEWLDANAQRRYPLSDTASVVDRGGFQLPNDFLVDLTFPVPFALDVDVSRFYLASLSTFGDVVTCRIDYLPDGGVAEPTGTFTVYRKYHVANRSYPLTGMGTFQDCVGRVAVGRLDNLFLGASMFQFDLDGGRIEPCCFRQAARGVSWIELVDGTGVVMSDRLTGAIRFRAGDGVRIVQSGDDGLQFSAGYQDGMEAACNCDPENTRVARNPVLTINRLKPDKDGNIDLLGTTCLDIQPKAGEAAIHFANNCSKSCCGCDELNAITRDFDALRQQVANVHSQSSALYGVALQSAVNTTT